MKHFFMKLMSRHYLCTVGKQWWGVVVSTDTWILVDGTIDHLQPQYMNSVNRPCTFSCFLSCPVQLSCILGQAIYRLEGSCRMHSWQMSPNAWGVGEQLCAIQDRGGGQREDKGRRSRWGRRGGGGDVCQEGWLGFASEGTEGRKKVS